MRKLISFFHISLDGFVAGPNGEMNWIIVDENIFDFVGDQIRDKDTALYGRVTWNMMEGYWPTAGQEPGASKHDIEHSAWYARVKKIVLSKSMAHQNIPNTTIVSDEIEQQINSIKETSGSDIPIFGSPSATHALLQANLVDGYWLFVNPIILGAGIPAFKNVADLTRLKLIQSKTFENGVVFLHYERG
jgi:dihydrofolate reductase